MRGEQACLVPSGTNMLYMWLCHVVQKFCLFSSQVMSNGLHLYYHLATRCIEGEQWLSEKWLVLLVGFLLGMPIRAIGGAKNIKQSNFRNKDEEEQLAIK